MGKIILNGVEYTSGTKNIIDTALSSTSTNAVQNKVVTAKLNELSEMLDAEFLEVLDLLGGEE